MERLVEDVEARRDWQGWSQLDYTQGLDKCRQVGIIEQSVSEEELRLRISPATHLKQVLNEEKKFVAFFHLLKNLLNVSFVIWRHLINLAFHF